MVETIGSFFLSPVVKTHDPHFSWALSSPLEDKNIMYFYSVQFLSLQINMKDNCTTKTVPSYLNVPHRNTRDFAQSGPESTYYKFIIILNSIKYL